MAKVIAITGGIGAGKSVVSRILRCEGYDVYDCDREAKLLMDSDEAIKEALVERIHRDAVTGGRINRKLISGIVFKDAEKLADLNDIVHSAVRRHLARWIASGACAKALFVETAILYQSGIDRMVDEVWAVTAPVDVRVGRVMERNSLSDSDVRARIEVQDSYIPESVHSVVRHIDNDGARALLPQIKGLLSSF